MSTLLGETVAESEADEVKALSEKLEIINLQFARRKAVRRAALHWLLIAVCGGILAVAAVLAAVNSPYLGWDYSAPETLRRCAIPRIFDLWGIDIRSWSAVRTLSEQEYVLFQAAKGIWQSQRTITIPELCDRKLVEDKTLELILNAALIAHYGRAMLAFDRLEGRA